MSLLFHNLRYTASLLLSKYDTSPLKHSSLNRNQTRFIIAQGETFDLPWTQVMNVHNAFLFTENAA